jgi:Family of unknown function (DUF6499)
MSQMALHIDPEGPPSPAAYEYLCTATMPDWAWEYLRRNFDYQASARLGHRRGVVRQRLSLQGRPSPSHHRGLRSPRAEAFSVVVWLLVTSSFATSRLTAT